MANICRSPTAEAVFRQRVAAAGLAGQVRIDSAGTHATSSTQPDVRAIARAGLRGYRLEELRSRALKAVDFERFDMVVAMDEANLMHLHRHCAEPEWHRLHLLTTFCVRNRGVTAVPDPYYSNVAGFDRVLDLVEDACDGLLLHVKQQLLPY